MVRVGARSLSHSSECEKWVDLNNLEPPDLILQMVRQLVLDLKQVGFGNGWTKVRGFFGEMAELLNSDVELKDLKLKADPVEIGVAIKEVRGARAKLRKHLEDRLPRLYDLVNNEILLPAREWLAGEGYEDILIIVDQLDRIPQKADRRSRTHQPRAAFSQLRRRAARLAVRRALHHPDRTRLQPLSRPFGRRVRRRNPHVADDHRGWSGGPCRNRASDRDRAAAR